MALKNQKQRGKRDLTRGKIVAASLRVLEHRGYGALTIRNVAAELGVKSASLYWHFRTKEELEDELADELLAGLKSDDKPEKSWRDELRELATRFYRHLKSKRDASALLAGRFVTGPNALYWMERGLRIFRRAGLSDREAAFASHAVRVYVQGFVTFENGPLSALQARGASHARILSATRKKLAALPVSEFPNVVALAAALTEPDDGERFLFGLDLLIAGLAERER